MKTLMIGECNYRNLYELNDPTEATEVEFEADVVRALSCLFPQYMCVVYGGAFLLEGRVSCPDLALIARDYSHWFVIEVELVSHSLEGHVLPQVRAFRYGEPQSDSVRILARELAITEDRAATLLHYVPRSVAVVANKRDPAWGIALNALNVQLLSVSTYGGASGVRAYEIEGDLHVTKENLGFGVYSETDRSVRLASTARIPLGRIQLHDPEGAPSWWEASNDGKHVWLTKERGVLDVPHDSVVQLMRTVDGKILLCRPMF